MTDFDFQLDNFMIYCSSKNLSRKTLASYEQTLKLFGKYLQEHFKIEEVKKAQSGLIRQYIKYLRERGKYTVVNKVESKYKNHPENRTDYKKDISMTTIANYVRNIKVFFNYLDEVEREIPKNPVESEENPKVQRKVKKILTAEEIKKGGYIDYAVFDRYCRVEIFFVTRLKSNTQLEPMEEMDVPAGSLVSADCLVRSGSQQQQQKKHALQMVQTEDSQGNLLFLVTNRFDLTCDEISERYRSRWAIETFFKWMKQHLQIKHLYRTSEQAVTNQIWIALACCLLVLVKLETDRKMPLASCRSIYYSGLNCFVNRNNATESE